MAFKPLGLCFFGGLLLLFLLNYCNLTIGLESNYPSQIRAVVSYPDEDADNSSAYVEFSNPNTIIQDNDINGLDVNLPPTTTEPSFPGIREKIDEIESSNTSYSQNNGIVVNLRGRSGIVTPRNRNNPQQKTMRDGHITWNQAYDSSVKRVVVRSRPDANVVPNNRNIVKFQPIVPKVTTPSAEINQINNVEIENNVSTTSPLPPPHEQVAKMARFIVHNSNWTSMATISSRPPTTGFPFVNIFSVSDGSLNNSSGIPYFYMTPIDVTACDLKVNAKSSLTMSLAQGSYCKSQSFDPEDPRCARVLLTGSIVTLKNGTSEYDFARESLFSRHPVMSGWPHDHDWFFAKLEIAHILVLDYFGGAKSVTVEDYFSAGAEN